MQGRADHVSEDSWVDVQAPRAEPKYVTVTVNQSDIDNGIRSPFDFKTDPVSMAIKRTVGASFAMAGWAVADTWANQIKTQWNLWPFKTIRDWILAWQAKQPVEPFTFRMYKEREVDVTPKESKRKPRKFKPLIETMDEQRKLDLK